MYDFVDEKLERVSLGCDGGLGDVASAEPGAEVPSEVHAETRHKGEFSFDLHGKSHPDALYRAAGGEGLDEDRGCVLYGCPCCGRTVGRVLRVRATRKSAWRAVCAMCAAATLAKNPEALIGGVVKAGRRKKRALREAG